MPFSKRSDGVNRLQIITRENLNLLEATLRVVPKDLGSTTTADAASRLASIARQAADTVRELQRPPRLRLVASI
jgi:hypothetical protein